MSYDGVSIREAMEKLNALNNGWFLPQVQRQFVWGARHESEHYVCLLLDSLWRRFPIGGVVLWETSKPVPFREFVRDYAPGRFAHQVEEGRWGAAKSLVYDGQQRLQTLYSVLYHSFNGRVLHFDLYFDPQLAESDETGFLFRDADATPDARYLKLTSVMHLPCNSDTKVELEDGKLDALKPDDAGRRLVRRNLGAIWDIFIDTNIKSIAYFSVKADTPAVVNEVFRRLNTGGVALTELELVLSDIKAVQSDYEEDLWALSERIAKQSGGIVFTSASILQFFYRDRVDVLWNFQPMPAGVNNYKRARHPKEFFNSTDGGKYWEDYDFVPPAYSAIWDKPRLFVWSRHRKMRQALLKRYGLKLKRLREAK